MKLKTKFQDEDFRLGEICEASITTGRDGYIKVEAPANDGGWHEFYYKSFKDMLDEWEDAPEEPKGKALRWMILTLENFIENEPDDRWIDLEDCKQMLEKLKAGKRLKDKGFRFEGWEMDGTIWFETKQDEQEWSPKYRDDLDLLFGGKE